MEVELGGQVQEGRVPDRLRLRIPAGGGQDDGAFGQRNGNGDESSVRVDRRAAAEWIVRIMLSFAVMPSAVVDLDDHEAVRAYVARYIVRGFAP